jgi:hypothetical protein
MWLFEHGNGTRKLVERIVLCDSMAQMQFARPPMFWPKFGAKWRPETSGSSMRLFTAVFI